MIKINFLFFGNLSSQLNTASCNMDVNESQLTIAEVKAKLIEENDSWREPLSNPAIQCALNQTLAHDDDTISENCEIAFFPPVTGG